MWRSLWLAAVWLALLLPARADDYPLSPDSLVQAGVPRGEVRHAVFQGSRLYPGTVRDYWVYVPRQYDPSRPACLMVFQDGGGYADPERGWRVPTVFDNLIAKGEMPVTVAVMVNPGIVPAADPANQLPRFNRSVEYDSVDDRYVRFLLEELLPQVEKSVALTHDPRGRGIAGSSSGGICAFTAAWQRPDAFSKVLGFISSFTDLRGGHGYPTLIRKTEPKPLRLFLQEGVNDQDIYSGSWPLGNSDVAAALRFAGYDFRYVTGDGGHDSRQGVAILPEALRWLWRGYPGNDLQPGTSRQPVMDVLLAGEGWTPVPLAAPITSDLAADGRGNVYAVAGGSLWKVAPDGVATRLRPDAGGAERLVAGSDGRIFAAQPGKQRIVAWDAQGRETVRVRGAVDAFVVHASGALYTLDARRGRIWRFAPDGKGKAVGQVEPGCAALHLSPDQSLLYATPPPGQGKFITSCRIAPEGSLVDVQAYHDLALAYGQPGSGASSLASDAQGWLDVRTTIGIQMLDQAGRVNGVIRTPGREGAGALAFGGAGRSTLYLVDAGRLYRRATRAVGVSSALPPIKPPGPRL